jgi:glycosyltransferase involved in cell wall biosynthesis
MHPTVSAIVCTHNPDRALLQRCLDHLRRQNLPSGGAEVVIIDNASSPPLSGDELGLTTFPCPARLVREESLGLSHARQRGAAEANGDVVVYVDDDNLLAPDFLDQTARFFAAHPKAGAAGGRIHALSDAALPPWFPAIAGHLAIRDWGGEPRCFSSDSPEAPTGAGLAVRRKVLLAAFEHPLVLADRRGRKLSSGGDTEICYRVRLAGWELWYAPALQLAHVLPARRLELDYLEGLSYQFGVSIPCLEFYTFPTIPCRRIFYLRRALYHWREARARGQRLDREARDPDTIKERLSIETMRGAAAGYFQAVFGPPLWEIAAKFTAHPPVETPAQR